MEWVIKSEGGREWLEVKLPEGTEEELGGIVHRALEAAEKEVEKIEQGRGFLLVGNAILTYMRQVRTKNVLLIAKMIEVRLLAEYPDHVKSVWVAIEPRGPERADLCIEVKVKDGERWVSYSQAVVIMKPDYDEWLKSEKGKA